jgi:hypothetical protein
MRLSERFLALEQIVGEAPIAHPHKRVECRTVTLAFD